MKKILVIEDETQTRDIFLKCLSFEGFFALGAESGLAGMKLAQTHLPDLIVCDIMMPDVDGYTVLSTLRQNSSTAVIPFIFLTAKVTMTNLRRGMELGADDYLTKPCTVEQFLLAIATRLQRQETLKHWYANTQLESLSATNAAPANPKSIFPNNPKLAKVFRFIEAHYHQSISLADVAQTAGYSPAYLTNLVQSQTGRTVKQWITERRMSEARNLLVNTAHSVSQIAETVGYADVSYFIRQFRQFHNTSPQAWRNSINFQEAEAQAV
ncbi:response regulator [Leptolyngbya sp. FACHB-671]|uniref:response regulator transcription factor n=1 Tax=Leptolyngbya sp. FACHB-671 TaxID=2692812 RepID=UPI00168A2116|nr:helix-turn-helix domain-containing protein [Leptolyngbya sp. FACHB-671]MBD2068754.1 response regulator [Leptolyngbya sp. FACHB-671]